MLRGRKAKPAGQAVNRHRPAHDWVEVPDVPFVGPRMPKTQPNGEPWPPTARRWWKTISTMPHCVLWQASDWCFVEETLQIVAALSQGQTSLAREVRYREAMLGVTVDSRRNLRIRYVDPAPVQDEEIGVVRLDDYRDL